MRVAGRDWLTLRRAVPGQSVVCVTNPPIRPLRSAARAAGAFAAPYAMAMTSGIAAICSALMPIIRSVRSASAPASPSADEKNAGHLGAHAEPAQRPAVVLRGRVVQRGLARCPQPQAGDGLRDPRQLAERPRDVGLVAQGVRRGGVGHGERRVEDVGRPAGRPGDVAHDVDRAVVAVRHRDGPGQLDHRHRGQPGQRPRHRADRPRDQAMPSTSSGTDDLCKELGGDLPELPPQQLCCLPECRRPPRASNRTGP